MAEEIQLYTWATPNGRKVSIMLEETGLPYAVHAVDLRARQHLTPQFSVISPWQKIPAIVDPAGPDGQPFTAFESTAILVYLAEKTGRFLPAAGAKRYEVLNWLILQTAGIGPLCGQGQVFGRFMPERNEGAIAHFRRIANGLMTVLDAQLGRNEFLAGADYSIADIATWPWIARTEWYGVQRGDYPNLTAWFERIGERPAVRRGYKVPGDDSIAVVQLPGPSADPPPLQPT